MKTIKKLTATLLMLALVFSLLPVVQVEAETTQETPMEATVDSFVASFRAIAPYQVYACDENKKYYRVKYTFDKPERAFGDDLGIGLKSDGTPDVVEDGKGYMSVLRMVAILIRNHVINTHLDEWFPDGIPTDSKEYSDQVLAKSNGVMKNYMKIKDTPEGKYLEALSADGVNWNTGLAKTGTVPFSSHWVVYINGSRTDKPINTVPVKDGDDIDLALAPENMDNGIDFDFDELPLNYIPVEGSVQKIKLIRIETDESGNTVNTALPGQTVSLYRLDSSQDVILVDTMTTDANGYIEFSPKNEGKHYLVCCEEYDDGKGNVYSLSGPEVFDPYVYEKPVKAKSVTVKATGKKKAKKNIKVSFKPGKSSSYNNDELQYNVYLSKKKDKGYKKVASVKGKAKMNVTVKNKKKGTYYIKIQAVHHTTYLKNNKGVPTKVEAHIKGYFTTPQKVVVK